MGNSSTKFEIIHQTIMNDNNAFSIKELCEIAGVSRSGYYNWVKSSSVRETREKADQEAFNLILQAYNFRGYKKGVRSIHMRLLHMGISMNPKKIRRLMHKYNLFCPIRKANPYRRMAKAMKTNNYADNILNRQFEAYGPRMVLLTDITYIPFMDTFCYLSVIMDAYTKQVLAYELSPSLEIDFVLQTVQKLVSQHGATLKTDTLIHSDQGCHYTSHKFIEIISEIGIRRSMSRRGNCWDNAPQESFFGHMKDEIDISEMTIFEEIESAINDWIDYYNNDRYQWKLAKLSPNEYYNYVNTGEYPLRGSAP